MSVSNMPRIRRFSSPVYLTCISMLVVFSLLSVSGCDALISADKRVQRAADHRAKGQHRPAMAELKTALQNDPEHVEARIALADLSLWLGDLEGAEKDLNRAMAAGAADERVRSLQYQLLLAQQRFDEIDKLLATDSVTPSARRLVIEAQVAQGRGDPAQAEEKLRLALESAPEDPEALLELARLAVVRGEVEPALDLPERVAQSGDIHARALLLKGAVLMNQGLHRQAREAFSSAQTAGNRLRAPEQLSIAAALTEANLAINDVPAAETSLRSVRRWAPESLIVHYQQARIAMLKGDYVAAVADSQRALRIVPRHIQSQILLAAAHLAQGSMEQAEEVLTRLLAANPESLGARKLLAQVYLGRNQPAQAQRVLEGAGIAADAETDWLMGAALLKSGSTQVALQHLEKSAAAEPDNDTRQMDLAGAYIAAGKTAKAAELLSAIPAESAAAPRAKAMLVLAAASGKSRVEGLREVNALLQKHPEDVTLLSAAGAYLGSQGERARATEVLERAIDLDPEASDARLTLARLQAGAGNVVEAERSLLEIIKTDPAHQPARIMLAELSWGAGERMQSRKWLEEAISADPSAVEPRLRLARMAFVEGDAPRARGLLEQAVSVGKDRNAVLIAAGQVLARAGFSDEALARFSEASAAGDADAILHASRVHLELGQPAKARALLEPALASRPNWPEASQMLVMVDARDGQVQRAFERAKALAGHASAQDLRVLQGDLHAIAGDADAAITAYEAAQKHEPSARIAMKLFNIRRMSGSNAAELSLTQWLHRTPEDVDVRRLLAAHYESVGQGEQAIAEYERLLAGGRTDPATMNNLAWALHEKGDPRALELAQRAYTAAPHTPEIGDTYGWILVQMGKVSEGLGVLEKALAKAPANPDIQYHAAVAYAKSGQNARAVELLRQSLQTAEPFHSRKAAEQFLQTVAAPTRE